MGRMDYLYRDDRNSNTEIMQLIETMRMADELHAIRTGRSGRPSLTRGMPRSSGHANSGWRNRGLFFWVMLIIMSYLFILKPLGLTLTKNF